MKKRNWEKVLGNKFLNKQKREKKNISKFDNVTKFANDIIKSENY